MQKNSDGKLEPVRGYLEKEMRKIPFLNGAVSLPLFPTSQTQGNCSMLCVYTLDNLIACNAWLHILI